MMWNKGEKLTAIKLNEWADFAQNGIKSVSVNDVSNLSGVGIIQKENEKPIFAKITAYSSGKHSWVEVYPETPTTFSEIPGGHSGSSTDSPLYEINGKTIPVDTIVEVFPGAPGEWLTDYYQSGAMSECFASVYVGDTCWQSEVNTNESITVTITVYDSLNNVIATGTGLTPLVVTFPANQVTRAVVTSTGYWDKEYNWTSPCNVQTDLSGLRPKTQKVKFTFKMPCGNDPPAGPISFTYFGNTYTSDSSGVFIGNLQMPNLLLSLSQTITILESSTVKNGEWMASWTYLVACIDTIRVEKEFFLAPPLFESTLQNEGAFVRGTISYSDDYVSTEVPHLDYIHGVLEYTSEHSSEIVECASGSYFDSYWDQATNTTSVRISIYLFNEVDENGKCIVKGSLKREMLVIPNGSCSGAHIPICILAAYPYYDKYPWPDAVCCTDTGGFTVETQIEKNLWSYVEKTATSVGLGFIIEGSIGPTISAQCDGGYAPESEVNFTITYAP